MEKNIKFKTLADDFSHACYSLSTRTERAGYAFASLATNVEATQLAIVRERTSAR